MNTPPALPSPQPARISRAALAGRIIDVHNHIGISIKSAANTEYPYAATAEGIAYRQSACGVDASVVFPYTPDLYFDPVALKDGRMVPAAQPLSPAPYAAENALVMAEVFRFCPELSRRLIPFVSIDPGRAIAAQLQALEALEAEYPVYGVKIVPVLCQSPVSALLREGRPLMDYALARRLPCLFHASPDKREGYSYAGDILDIMAAYPALRYCLAHAIGFHRGFLEAASRAANVWVDTGALKIQCELVHAGSPLLAHGSECFDSDYTDHRRVMQDLAAAYPDTIVWGSDTPAYSYIVRRRQGGGVQDFRLKATYEDEVAALRALAPAMQQRVGSSNTLDFLFGL
ncbi:MAG: amidohydrolase family protein [Kiritimatiellae bacterium]|nr:amidohydrolase family protein [Kiritimatiellia bacterium]